MLLYAVDQAFVLKVLKVNTASSRKIIGNPSDLALSSYATMVWNRDL